jgi:hypothetical protein
VRRLAAVVVATAVTACSFIGARVPHARGMDGHLECPEASITADVGGAALAGVIIGAGGVAYAIADGRSGGGGGGVSPLIFGVPVLVVGGIYAVSALYGHHVRKKCRRLDEDQTYAPDTTAEARERAAQAHARSLATKGAAAAARGDCAAAITIAETLRDLDESILLEYAREAAVAKCFVVRY